MIYQCKIQSAEGWTRHRWVKTDELNIPIVLPSATGLRTYHVTQHYEPALHEDTFKKVNK